jgi:DNA-directed RNA polymerase subunit E'/Rpb7
MEERKISLVVSLEPKFLDGNINKHIEDSLNKQIGTCTQDTGYLIEIKSFVISDTEISRASSDIIIRVKVVAMVLRPQIDREYPVVVSTCINGNGIYAHCYEKLKILIMERNFTNFKFENGKYVFPDKTIQHGDKHTVVIKAIKYEKNSFQCIGVLKF